MTTNIGPWPLDSYPPIRAHATANITPFTYYDGLTFLEILSELRTWLSKTLIPGLDGIIGIVDGMIQDALENVELDLEAMRQEVNDALASIDVTDAELRAYVDDVLQQVINNSIELQDSVLAGIVADGESESGAALRDLFVQTDTIHYNARDHGVIGDGVADDTQTMQALIDSVPEGATIYAPRGTTYLTAGWEVAGKSVILDLSAAHLIQTAAKPIVEAWGEWEPFVLVGSVDANRRTLTVADSSGLSAGDLVKIVSDDAMWDARVNVDGVPRQGQFTTITIVAGNQVTVNPPLEDEYLTNIRVARHVNHHVEVRFGTSESAPGGKFAQFRLHGLDGPVLKGRILSGNGTGVSVHGCYMADVWINVADLPAGDGYGVILGGTELSNIRVNGTRCRHTFSDGPGSNRTPVGSDDPNEYGRTMNNIVSGISTASSGSGVDTHHGSVGNTFLGMLVSGTAGNEPGFSMRGRSHKLLSCSVEDAAWGYRFFDEHPVRPEGAEQWASCEGHYMAGCSSRRTYRGIYVNLVNLKVPSRGPTITIDGGSFESRSGGTLMEAHRARIRFNNATFRQADGNMPDRPFVFGHTDLSGSMNLDLMASNDALDCAIFMGPTADRRSVVDLDVNIQATQATRGNSAVWFRWGAAMGEVRLKLNGAGNAFPGGSYDSSYGEETQTMRFRAVGVNGPGDTLAAKSQTLASGASAITLSRSSEPFVFIHVNAASTFTAYGLSVGAFSGQEVLVRVNGSSDITIPHSAAARTNIGSAVTLSPGDGLRLTWDGRSGRWVRSAGIG